MTHVKRRFVEHVHERAIWMAAIRKEVGEYIKEQTAISLSKSISDVSRGSRYLKFTPTFKALGRPPIHCRFGSAEIEGALPWGQTR
ncbi:MAG: hypothetical protein WAN86_13160, partial [Hyphomicrobiaceae bacterium]